MKKSLISILILAGLFYQAPAEASKKSIVDIIGLQIKQRQIQDR